MKRCIFVVASCFALLAVLAKDVGAVPVTTAFTGRISDSDGPIDTAVNLIFKRYPGSFMKSAVYNEGRSRH